MFAAYGVEADRQAHPGLTKLLTPLAEQVETKELRPTVRVDGFLPTGA